MQHQNYAQLILQIFLKIQKNSKYYKECYDNDKAYEDARFEPCNDFIERNSLEALKIKNHLDFMMNNAKDSDKRYVTLNLSSKQITNELDFKDDIILDWARFG